ncbi:MAG: alanine racemase [Candidatus Gallimonas sp.]
MQNHVAVISLGTIRDNAKRIVRAAGGTPLYAVVKDDAYGHGAERVALALSEIAAGFAVATVDEGAALRVAGVGKEILVLTPPISEEDVLRGAAYSLTLTISCLSVLRLVRRTEETYGFSVRAHIAVNTGMNRYGFRPDRLKSACREAEQSGTEVCGVYSHLYAPQDCARRAEQTALFAVAADTVRAFYPNAVRHLAATGGILAGAETRFDAVRSGIALYGYLPEAFSGTLGVKPAMKIYTHVVQSGKFFGGGAGYAPAEREYGALRTVRLGYGDGFFRAGRKDAIGNLCMDAYVREGRSAFGRRCLAIKDVAAYAREHGTIVYEALCNIARKAEKRYVE